jgi:glycosyltransferase involved in cell wall biosynthesis
VSASRREPEAREHVLIDALAARFGGTAYAVIQLAPRLLDRPEVRNVTVLTRRGSIVARGLAKQPAVTCVLLNDARRFELVKRIIWQAFRLPALVAHERCDVLITLSGMLPRSAGCRLICLLFNPVMYERRTAANAVRRWAVRRTAGTASYLAAPSRAMASLVTASLGRPCEVVPLGVDHSLFSPTRRVGTEILCVADFYAHKRHDLLIDIWASLPAPRPLLRLVGDPAVDPKAHAKLLKRIALLADSDAVVFQRELSVDRLVDTYHRARVFVLPSERESFCMPLVESMASGVPAVVRSLPSLQETGGNGARYVSGDGVAGWVAALLPLLGDDGEHARARELAQRAAARFSWDAFAAVIARGLGRAGPTAPGDA